MSTPRALLLALFVIGSGLTSAAAGAPGSSEPDHSSNIRELASAKALEPGINSSIWEIAFQKDLIAAAVDGNDPDTRTPIEGMALFRRNQEKPYLERISFYRCRGSFGDVALWRDFAFLSIPVQPDPLPNVTEAPNNELSPSCNNTNDSRGKAGIRIVDISEPRRPRQVGFIASSCGANRLTLLPKGEGLLIYGIYDCATDGPHPTGGGFGGLQVACFDPRVPSRAEICAITDITPLNGCLDFIIHTSRRLAACVDYGRFALMDMTDPYNPEIIGDPIYIGDLLMSGAFTWDGQFLVVSDAGMNSGGETCSGSEDSPRLGLRFYSVEDVDAPVEVSRWSLPRAASSPCYPGMMGVLPTRDGRYLVTVAHGNGGLSVVDFSEPAAPREIAHYLWPRKPVYSAYWYNGLIYTARGGLPSTATEALTDSAMSVLRLKDAGLSEMRYFRNRYNPQTIIEDFR